jgi:hypothetical protein
MNRFFALQVMCLLARHPIFKTMVCMAILLRELFCFEILVAKLEISYLINKVAELQNNATEGLKNF